MTEEDIQKIKNDYYERFLGYSVFDVLTEHEEEKIDIWDWFEEKLRNFS